MMPRAVLLLLLLMTVSPQTVLGESRKSRKLYDLCSVSYPSDASVDWECRRLRRGETAETLVGERWLDLLRFNRIDRRHLNPGVSIKIPLNPEDIADFTPLPETYPDAANEGKFILVDLSEQFLGAYEYGELVYSTPVASGNRTNRTPAGDFRVDAFSRNHKSSLYKIEKTTIPYPMHYGLRFFVNRSGIAFWIHGRDVPGFPASHGCVGLYDEEMQRRFYRSPWETRLEDARALYEWAIGDVDDSGEFTRLQSGPRVKVIGQSPL